MMIPFELPRNALQAAERGNVSEVEAFLNAGVHVNARSRFMTCLIHVAAKYGHAALLKLLIDRGAYVNALDYVKNQHPFDDNRFSGRHEKNGIALGLSTS